MTAQHFGVWLKSHPTDAETRSLMTQVWIDSSQYKKAIDYWQELLYAKPNDPDLMGALAGILGSMMALEAIREIVGFGESLVGRLLMVDARSMRFETLCYQRDPKNPLNGDAPDITDLSGHR